MLLAPLCAKLAYANLPTGNVLISRMDSSSQIRVGTAGWSYKDWEGIFYPPGMQHRKQHPLEILAQCFDMVEINTSFYGHIKPHLAKLWIRTAKAVNPTIPAVSLKNGSSPTITSAAP